MKPINGWWFGGNVLPNGDGRRIRRNSTLTVQGELVLCLNGLHMSRSVYDALMYATTCQLWRVQAVGDVVETKDKLCTSRRRHIVKIDAEPILRKFARMCALETIHMWDAPEVVVEYLKSGDERLRSAARDAAWAASWASASDNALDSALAAARAASWASASAAARAAASDAAREKQSRRLERMCLRAVKEKANERRN